MDAERFNGKYVRDYNNYANIAIGLYMAAAGVNIDDALSIADSYAAHRSSSNLPKDEVYTHLPRRDVENIKKGYALYFSGRIGRGQ